MFPWRPFHIWMILERCQVWTTDWLQRILHTESQMWVYFYVVPFMPGSYSRCRHQALKIVIARTSESMQASVLVTRYSSPIVTALSFDNMPRTVMVHLSPRAEEIRAASIVWPGSETHIENFYMPLASEIPKPRVRRYTRTLGLSDLAVY